MRCLWTQFRYVKASADKLKFFQAQFDSACTMRDRYKSELERSQVELKQNLSKVGDESEAIARAHEQVRLIVKGRGDLDRHTAKHTTA